MVDSLCFGSSFTTTRIPWIKNENIKIRIFVYGSHRRRRRSSLFHRGHTYVRAKSMQHWLGSAAWPSTSDGISGHIEHDLYVIITDYLRYVVITILMCSKTVWPSERCQLPNPQMNWVRWNSLALTHICSMNAEQEVIARSFGNCLNVWFVNLKVKIVFLWHRTYRLIVRCPNIFIRIDLIATMHCNYPRTSSQKK